MSVFLSRKRKRSNKTSQFDRLRITKDTTNITKATTIAATIFLVCFVAFFASSINTPPFTIGDVNIAIIYIYDRSRKPRIYLAQPDTLQILVK